MAECEGCFEEVPEQELVPVYPGGPRNKALQPSHLCADCRKGTYAEADR